MAVENTVGIAVISLAFIGGGYLLVFGLWYLMVYRPSREERHARAERAEGSPPDSDQAEDSGGVADAGSSR